MPKVFNYGSLKCEYCQPGYEFDNNQKQCVAGANAGNGFVSSTE